MELWVRSQDRKGLFKIDNISIVDYNGYYYVVSVTKGTEIILGKYEFHSSTRALEVLDSIQRRIEYINNVDNNTFAECVYEMPEE